MIQFQLFMNPKNKSEVVIVELKHKRLKNLHEVTYYPLLKEQDNETLKYPTRQQMHSKRYYVTKNYDKVCVLNDTGLDEAWEKARDVFRRAWH